MVVFYSGRRDWSNLPLGLIDDIAGRLLSYDIAEYIRLRAACKEWRKCTADPRAGGHLDSRFRPRRWILLSNRTNGDGRRFLNLDTGSCVRVDLPELSSHHLETSTDGLLLLRDKSNHTVRLLNPLTRALTQLPPITPELGSTYTVWTGLFVSSSRIIYAGISDETSPASVVLFMRDGLSSIAYAKPGDERWAVMDSQAWGGTPKSGSFRYSSVSILNGFVYFATPEGNIVKVTLRPNPRLVPAVVNQAMNNYNNVVSYLVPPEDHHRGMLMVRYYRSLQHLSADEQRIMKRKRKVMDVMRVEARSREYSWQLIQVFEVDLAAKILVPVEDIGRHRAVFVGDVVSFALSARVFPSVAGNAVYPGAAGVSYPPIGVRYLLDKSMDPPFQFTTDDETLNRIQNRPLKGYRCIKPELNLVPLARPCNLQEYLVCCAGLNGGLKD